MATYKIYKNPGIHGFRTYQEAVAHAFYNGNPGLIMECPTEAEGALYEAGYHFIIDEVVAKRLQTRGWIVHARAKLIVRPERKLP